MLKASDALALTHSHYAANQAKAEDWAITLDGEIRDAANQGQTRLTVRPCPEPDLQARVTQILQDHGYTVQAESCTDPRDSSVTVTLEISWA